MSSPMILRALLAHEHATARVILACALEVTPCMGRPPSMTLLVQVLTGHAPPHSDAERLATFGALADMGKTPVRAFAERMIETGLLDVLPRNKALVCTARARALMESSEPAREPLGLVWGTVREEEFMLARRSGLVDALVRLRSPDGAVLDAATVRELGASMPSLPRLIDMRTLYRVPETLCERVSLAIEEHRATVERLANACHAINAPVVS